MCDVLQVLLFEKDPDRYCNNSMYAPFQEEGFIEENAASDGDDFEWIGGHSAESGVEGINDDVYGDGFYYNWEEMGIDRLADLGCINLKKIRVDQIKMLHFVDQEVAFAFYNLYAKMNEFAARRESGRWIIIYFQEVHNHKMLEDTLTFMLPRHRIMNAAAINQMNMMLKVGIRTPQIYASFVQTAGGHKNVPFRQTKEAHWWGCNIVS
ncbi:hypothetical protein Ahy_A10g050035 [Arachis hypogaea]|uniref:Protein FAR1-RELATED SEQUENCE n=1 Tax=Arachis hypogaea TaxID=3818 RepID=A0A445B8F6_ARAHY|nr:hypothetical protein Ahy_A10g050035 [Arachis hypogaea]